MKIVYTRRSQADLEAIFDHGLQWGKLHAMRVERRIRTECASLAKFPELGIKTDIKGVRRFPIVRYPLTIFTASTRYTRNWKSCGSFGVRQFAISINLRIELTTNVRCFLDPAKSIWTRPCSPLSSWN